MWRGHLVRGLSLAQVSSLCACSRLHGQECSKIPRFLLFSPPPPLEEEKKRAKRSFHSRTGRRTMFQVGAGQWSGTLWCCALSVSGRITRRQAKNEWKSSHFTFCVSWLCEQNARRVSIVCRSADSLKFARKSAVDWNWMKFAPERELNVLITKVITPFPNSMLKRLKWAVYWVTLRVICIPWG